jgi:serine/threonine protein kinase
MFQRWQTESKGHWENVELFTRWMVNNRYVTPYQAMLLSHGHSAGFFLDQYKILDRLGRGRMAGVYKAVHQLGAVVAIKVLPPSKARDPQLLRRFQREARLALRLKHPNVVRSFQIGDSNSLKYIVMEYLEGETLDEALHRRRKLPHGEAARVVYQALQGLQHIHEQGLVHRDVKPSNLMLVPGPQAGQPDTTLRATVKILDIGLGRTLFDDSAPPPADEPHLTGEGVLLGTPDYLAPEQARDARAVDIRADIYSLGCVLYHCLTGQPPFPDTNIINQMIRHATETPRSIKDFSPDVPEALQQVVYRMLAKDPNQRHPTPEKAAQALQPFIAAGELPRALEVDPQMSSFLTWVEGVNGTSEPASLAGRLKKRIFGERARKKKRRERVPVAAPVAPPAGGVPAESRPHRSKRALKKRRARLTRRRRERARRQLLMLLGGVLAVAAAIAAGWLLAWLRQA